ATPAATTGEQSAGSTIPSAPSARYQLYQVPVYNGESPSRIGQPWDPDKAAKIIGLRVILLNRDQVGTRSFASNSGSSSNLGQRRSTRATGSRLMRAMKAWQAPSRSGTVAWQKPRLTSSRIQSHSRSMGLRSGL